MRKVFTWVMAAMLTACGGKVFVDGSSGGTTTGGSSGGFGGAPTTTGNNGGVGAVFDGAGGSSCPTCAQALQKGGVPCDGVAFMDYVSLVQGCIACSGAGVCHVECKALCNGGPATPGCEMCISASCGPIFTQCLDN